MKIFESKIDNCSGYKTFSILEFKNGRALFAIKYGYFSIFWRIWHSNFQLVDIGVLESAIDPCDIESQSRAKLEDFWNEPLPLSELVKIHLNNSKLYREYIRFISLYKRWNLHFRKTSKHKVHYYDASFFEMFKYEYFNIQPKGLIEYIKERPYLNG